MLVLIILAVGAIYIFIPARINIAETTLVKVNTDAAYRTLIQEKNWLKWWPASTGFTYNKLSYRLTRSMFNAFELEIILPDDSLSSKLGLVPVGLDSTAFGWSCILNTGNNPIKRFFQFRQSKAIKKNLNELLGRLNEYLANEENVYGFTVKEVKVVDSVLLSTRHTFDHYPDETDIGTMIRKLRNYISSQQALEKNYPMLNVRPVSEKIYETMVAIATDKRLPATENFAPKFVLKGGNILETEIRGGPFKIKEAVFQFELYKNDFRKVSPAIPYQLLVTDREKETDTTKWITKLYYPVF